MTKTPDKIWGVLTTIPTRGVDGEIESSPLQVGVRFGFAESEAAFCEQVVDELLDQDKIKDRDDVGLVSFFVGLPIELEYKGAIYTVGICEMVIEGIRFSAKRRGL